MRRAGIRGVARRKKGTTRRGPDVVPSDDLVCRQFGVDGPDVLWVADTGEHPTAEGKVYLAVVIDAWNRECIGWSIADHLRAELVCDAFDMARWQQPARTRLRAHPPCRPRNPIHLPGCSATGSARPASSGRWERSATPWTTPWPNPSSPPSRSNCWTGAAGTPAASSPRRSSNTSKPSTTPNRAHSAVAYQSPVNYRHTTNVAVA